MYENVYTPVTSITKSPVSTGGPCKIIFFKIEDVLNWPAIDPQSGLISAAIDLKPGKSFYFIEAAERNRTFSEDEKFSAAGPFMEMQVTSQLGGNSPNNILSQQAMMFHQYGIIVHDRDGNQRLIGNKDSGARLEFDYTTGDISSSRIRKVKWTWQHPVAAPIYTATAFTIAIGGITITTGCITFITRFRVGDPGAPMNDGDSVLTNAAFADTNLLIIASSMIIPCDDGSGAIDWTGSIERHYEKTFASDTATFIGNVVGNEIIEIYAIQ